MSEGQSGILRVIGLLLLYYLAIAGVVFLILSLTSLGVTFLQVLVVSLLANAVRLAIGFVQCFFEQEEGE